MSQPQQPGNWSDPSWSATAPTGPQDPSPYQSPTGYPDPTLTPAPGGYPVPTQPTGYPVPPPPAGYPVPGAPPVPAGYPVPTDPNAYPYQGGYPAPAGYPDPAAAYPGYGYPAQQPQNGMAIAALVVSIVAAFGLICYGLGGYLGIVGAILGHVAKRQISERGQQGNGMAMAGIIIGWIAAALAVLATIAIVIFIVAFANDPAAFAVGA